VLAHVLEIESSNYVDYIARAGDEILADCACARCGATDIRLTNCWVQRGFQVRGEYIQLAVVLARCAMCKARERVLPCDVLPGKVNGIENIFGALAEVQDGSTLTDAAERAGVSRQSVRYWIQGVAHRYLDLARLFRHRAAVASNDTPARNTLVMFWAFVAQARIQRPAIHWPATPLPAAVPADEVGVAAFGMVALLETAGGARVVAEVGASLFQQAVLLFRPRGVDSSISGYEGDDFEHGTRSLKNRRHAEEHDT